MAIERVPSQAISRLHLGQHQQTGALCVYGEAGRTNQANYVGRRAYCPAFSLVHIMSMQLLSSCANWSSLFITVRLMTYLSRTPGWLCFWRFLYWTVLLGHWNYDTFQICCCFKIIHFRRRIATWTDFIGAYIIANPPFHLLSVTLVHARGTICIRLNFSAIFLHHVIGQFVLKFWKEI